ncbi:MAG: hypothetical protein ACKVHQ_04040 [Gammaproteobacteria bacterium]|jgi:LPXTG-motif cell wall-anchored protein
MNTNNRIFVSIVTGFLLGLMPMTSVWSADEDMISQVYLEFDPETGEFTTAQDPELTGTSKHSLAQSKQVEEIQQAQNALVAGQDAAEQGVAAVTAAGQQSMDANDTGGGSNSTMLIAGVVALGLLIGIVAFIRKGQKTA